jgi:hypothetical protein
MLVRAIVLSSLVSGAVLGGVSSNSRLAAATLGPGTGFGESGD